MNVDVAVCDERIRTYLNEHLVHVSQYPAITEVMFEIKDGNVRLFGTVPHRAMKHWIEETALACPEVRHVENHLSVALTAPWPNTEAVSR